MISKMDQRLRGLLALLALLPSLAVLLDFVSLPPTQEQILRITIVTVSLAAAICIMLLSSVFQAINLKLAVILIVLSNLIGLGALYTFQETYQKYHDTCTVNEVEITVLLPLSPGPIQQSYGDSGICGLAQDDNSLGDELEANNRGTRLFLALLLAVGQLGLTVGILLGLIRLLAGQKD